MFQTWNENCFQSFKKNPISFNVFEDTQKLFKEFLMSNDLIKYSVKLMSQLKGHIVELALKRTSYFIIASKLYANICLFYIYIYLK